MSEGESSKEEEDEEFDDDEEEVRMPVKKKPMVTPGKSTRLASKGKRPVVVGLDDDSSSYATIKPQIDAPHSSPNPVIPIVNHIRSPPPSPIPFTPPPTFATPALPHL